MQYKQPFYKSRRLQGLLLITGFVLALFLLRNTILDDLNRMFVWQKILFWIGDAFAILLVLRWMFRPDFNAREHVGLPEFAMPKKKSITGRKFALLITFSLLIDIGATTLSQLSEYYGMQRAVVTPATIDSISEFPLKKGTHWKFKFSYTDTNQHTIVTSRTLTHSTIKPVQSWMIEPMEIAMGKTESDTVQVMFDPKKSTRVWFKDQDWGSTTGIGVLFSVIHIFQVIVVLSIIASMWNDKSPVEPTSPMYVLPLAIETVWLLIIGLAIAQS